VSKLILYYDGLCPVCSREVRHYHGIRGAAEQVEFVDYTDPAFDAAAEGLDRQALDRYLHARLPDGRMQVGYDAFVALWRAVPGYGWLARLASHRLLRPLFRLGYGCFAKVRPWLPKRKQSCPLKPSQPMNAR
jgi:predicted DCC family thiol-disulfide oxidoreductase YuxK